MAKDTLFDKIQSSMFSEDVTVIDNLTPHELDIRKRYMAVFSVWLENPTYTDKSLVNFLMRDFGIERSQAYRDVGKIRVMLSNVRNAGKEWHRYLTLQMSLESYNLAKKKQDPKAMTMATDKYGKYSRANQMDAEEIDWSKINVPDFDTSTDVTILNFKKDPDAERKRIKLRKKYSKDLEDAVYAEIINDGSGKG